MNKKIIKVEEKTMNEALNYLLSESFVPSVEQTLIVKEYLDKNFQKQTLDDIDENGYPKKIPVAVMMSGGQGVKTFQMSELLLLLVDKFNKMIDNEDDLKRFLEQIVKDWFLNRIGKTGILSKSFL